MCYPSANLPPLESIIWLFIWSTDSSAVRLNAAGCEQMLKCELAALWPQLHTASNRDALSCAIQTHSDDHRQQDITSSVLFSDMEIRSSWSPGGGNNSDTWHRSEANIRGCHGIGLVHVCQHVCAFFILSSWQWLWLYSLASFIWPSFDHLCLIMCYKYESRTADLCYEMGS